MMPNDNTYEQNGLLIKISTLSDYRAVTQYLWHKHLCHWINGYPVPDYNPIGKEIGRSFYLQVFCNKGKYTLSCADKEYMRYETRINKRRKVTATRFFHNMTAIE